MGVAAGLLVGAALLDLLPEAAELAPSSRLGVTVASATGFALFLVVDRLVHAGASGHREEGRERAFGSLAAVGLTIHSLLDRGVAVGAAFHADARVGVLVGVAVVAHDFGDGVSTVGVILGSKGALRASIGWLALDAAAPVAGALLALEATVPPGVLAGMLSFFGGSFLFPRRRAPPARSCARPGRRVVQPRWPSSRASSSPGWPPGWRGGDGTAHVA